MVVLYPVLWIASAFVFTHFVPEEDRYLGEVAAICKARTDAQDRMPQPLSVGVVLEMSAEETQRPARLRPPPEYRRWHQDVLREKREFDRLGRELTRAVVAGGDPVATFDQYEPRLAAEAAQHNALFAQVGLTDCAR